MADIVKVELPQEGMVNIPMVAVIGDGELELADFREHGDMVHVLTARGMMLYQRSELFESLTDLSDVKRLTRMKERLRFELAKIPVELVARINTFFAEVYYRYRSEAMVILFYDPKQREWMAHVPAQKVSYGGIDYENPTPLDYEPRFMRMGTWHSHASISAFHSGTDDNDEFTAGAGVHLTSGKFMQAFKEKGIEPEACASIVMGGGRFTVELEQVLECSVMQVIHKDYCKWTKKQTTDYTDVLIELPAVDVPAEWLAKVTEDNRWTSVGKGGAARGGVGIVDDEEGDWTGYDYSGQMYRRNGDGTLQVTKTPVVGGCDLQSCYDCGHCFESEVPQLFSCDVTNEYFCADEFEQANECTSYEMWGRAPDPPVSGSEMPDNGGNWKKPWIHCCPVTGDDIMKELGLSPGPLVGRLKEAIMIALEQDLTDGSYDDCMLIASEVLEEFYEEALLKAEFEKTQQRREQVVSEQLVLPPASTPGS